jgi:hypothetical protein
MATLIDIDPARQLIAAEHDLAADFPAVPLAEIHSMVLRENGRYDSAHVRDYVSILVTRAVRASLLTRSPSRRVIRRNGPGGARLGTRVRSSRPFGGVADSEDRVVRGDGLEGPEVGVAVDRDVRPGP